MGCELEKWKQSLLMGQVFKEHSTCMFTDVTMIGDDTNRHCLKHNGACVPSPRWYFQFNLFSTSDFVYPLIVLFASRL